MIFLPPIKTIVIYMNVIYSNFTLFVIGCRPSLTVVEYFELLHLLILALANPQVEVPFSSLHRKAVKFNGRRTNKKGLLTALCEWS